VLDFKINWIKEQKFLIARTKSLEDAGKRMPRLLDLSVE
jgi:hypothetical protein